MVVMKNGKTQVNVALEPNVVKMLDHLGASFNRPRTYIITRLITKAYEQTKKVKGAK